MKIALRVAGIIAISSGLSIASSAVAAGGFGGGFHGQGGHSGGFHGGGFRGGGVHEGFHGGVRGGFCFSPGISFGYWPYYYNPPDYDYGYGPTYYYSTPPAVVYSAPATVYSAPTVSSPTVNYESQRPVQSTTDFSSQSTAQPNIQQQPMTVDEIKALAKGGLGDAVIMSKIRSSQAVFHLTTAEILDLKNNGVSEKVIDLMINTATQR